MDIEILYEDRHLILVNKPAGIVVQQDKSLSEINLQAQVYQYLKLKKENSNPFIEAAHRIDRPTSGVVIFCKTSKALARVNKAFQDKTIQKKYLAITHKSAISTSGELRHYLKRSSRENKSLISQTPKIDYKEAILRYQVIQTIENYQMLEIELLTGRHHQIRAQLAHIGIPIKGDIKYGDKRSNEDKSIDLHAYKLKMNHPVGEEIIEVCAPIRIQGIWTKFKAI
ncbi:MAG: RNA pseudouridine synthase [Chitinophagales bacterium]|jgi:23S rRNA pseudouridine1911/1915/1917 synthase|nr:RNA pseudouridine synthase [Chitinophagales bacterium]